MKVYNVIECCHELDCGGVYSKIISAHKTLEGAMKSFVEKEQELVSPTWDFKIINPVHKLNRGEEIYRASYQNYCCNTTLSIVEKELND